jgi:geranylgeranyl reductase
LIEKNKIIGPKVCAGGITLKDLTEIPKEILDAVFKKIFVRYKNKSVLVERSHDLIATIDREKLGQYQLGLLNNTKVLTGTSVAKINNNFLSLDSGKQINFKFLVGADGSNSLVRNYLQLSTKKILVGFQYILPRQLENFELYLEEGANYLWIFPRKNCTSVGGSMDSRKKFELWLEKNKIDLTGAKFEAGVINYDYRGYRFGNIFLAGDAAGLASGLTGEGIYPAIISGKQIAREILGNNSGENLIEEWLAKKRKQEKYLFFLRRSDYFKHLFFSLLMKLIENKKMQEKIIDLVT